MSFILELEFPPPPFVMEVLIGTTPTTMRTPARDIGRALLAAVGPPGSPLTANSPGDGLTIVGNEIRIDIDSLPLAY